MPAPAPVCANDDELASQLVRRAQSDPWHGPQVLTGLDQLWVAEITYVHLADEFGYLAVVLDAFSRKVVGWALEAHLQAELATSALMMAITARQPPRSGLIHHSDRGAEYTEILAAHDIQPSMSRVGNPYDNAKAESFMKTLKQEEINGTSYRTLRHAQSAIGAFIETVYNRQRLHSALAYGSPEEYEAALGTLSGVTSSPESPGHRELLPISCLT